MMESCPSVSAIEALSLVAHSDFTANGILRMLSMRCCGEITKRIRPCFCLGLLEAVLSVVVQNGFVVSGSLIASSMRYRMEISTWIRMFAYSERIRRRTLDTIVAHWREYDDPCSDMPSLIDMPSLMSEYSEESSDYDFGSR